MSNSEDIVLKDLIHYIKTGKEEPYHIKTKILKFTHIPSNLNQYPLHLPGNLKSTHLGLVCEEEAKSAVTETKSFDGSRNVVREIRSHAVTAAHPPLPQKMERSHLYRPPPLRKLSRPTSIFVTESQFAVE